MAGQQPQSQRSNRYPNLLITVKRESTERSVTEPHSNPRTRRPNDNHRLRNKPSRTVFYNSNYRHTHPLRPSSMSCPKQCDRYLIEAETKQMTVPSHPTGQPREPQQRGQYRNRKAELDWDHTFDLDQIDLYTIQNDSDNRSLMSFTSSSDQSSLSVWLFSHSNRSLRRERTTFFPSACTLRSRCCLSSYLRRKTNWSEENRFNANKTN